MWYRNLITLTAGILVPIILPCLHFSVAYRWWTSYKRTVDKDLCSCSCWDTVFKGVYQETEAPGYKHFYFNVTWQSFLIWSITVAFVILLYESTKYLVNLARDGKLRLFPTLILLSYLYPHYYSWWSYLNAWNDDFYEQFFHQAIFSLTEAVSTGLVLPMCDKTRPPQPRHLVAITAIAFFHIAASGYDQFVRNVLWRNGEWHQFARDVGFMATDLVSLVFACLELRRVVSGTLLSSLRKALTFDEIVFSVFLILALSFAIIFT